MAVIAIGLSVATAKGVLVCCIVKAISNVGTVWGQLSITATTATG